MRVPYLVAVAMCLLMSSKSYASRGWYISIAGVSSKQKHETSEYKAKYTLPALKNLYTGDVISTENTFTITSTSKPVFTMNQIAATVAGYNYAFIGYKDSPNLLDPSLVYSWDNIGNIFSEQFQFCSNECDNDQKATYLNNSGDIISYKQFTQSFINLIQNFMLEFTPVDAEQQQLWTELRNTWVANVIKNPQDQNNSQDQNNFDNYIAAQDSVFNYIREGALETTQSLYTILNHVNSYIETFKTDMRNAVVAGTDPLGNNKYQITLADNADFFSQSEIGIELDGTQIAQTKRLVDGTIQTTFTKDYMNQTVEAYNADISAADKEIQTSIQTQQPLHDFLNALNGQSSKGAEMNIGYKFRNFNSSSFIAPQIDLSYFNSKPSRTLYTDSTSTSFSTTQDATHTNKLTKDFFDASYAAGLTTRMGLELEAHLGSIQIPFSVYGLFGGVGTQRQYENAKFKSFGLKYGAGGEIFLSRNLAFFGEFYQIDFLNTNVSNTQEVTTFKIAVTEQFKLKSNLKAIKVGLTYYFW